MKLATSFVPLRKVKPTASCWNFASAELDAAAQLVLEVEGVINPIVIRREDNSDSYVILDGNFEYYAVARAHRLNTRCCDSIEAFVIDSQDQATIQKQIALFRQASPSNIKSDLRYLATSRAASLDPEQPLAPICNNLLMTFNQASLEELLVRIKQIGLSGKNAEKVVEAIEYERRERPFASLKEVVIRIRGLSYEKMLDLVEGE